MSIGRIPKRIVIMLLATALAVAGLPTGNDAAGQVREAAAAGGPAEESYVVTLVTGDVVTYETHADGRATASVDPADRGDTSPGFESWEDGDDLYVIPTDVAALVGETLDAELFNVASLVEQGYHDANTSETPVIVTAEEGTEAPGPPRTPPGLAADRTLESIRGVAGAVPHDDAPAFGRALAEAASADRGRGRGQSSGPGRRPAARAADPLAGIDRISLDRQVEAHLNNTVDVVGAPVAWDAGYDGEGMTIAILDTGIDDTHPDLAGEVVGASNFSASETVSDLHGHGTHVASIAAGTGAASDGTRTGVAPGADLLNAKVLDDSGRGQESDIIAGMQWAVDEGADVLNLSLGAGPTDGTDPMSQAVNQMTDEHGVLFVISAGNSGPRDETVGTPGAADSALTVGGSYDSGSLAYFSSRGPRIGDYAPKPDITAPGANVGAALADDSGFGYPLGEHYTNASGTSMSAPHVAGAAALLAQGNPDWDATTLKGALMTAAEPNDSYTVYEQGAGPLDVAAALDMEVLATPAPLHLGYFPYPHDDYEPVTHEVTYTNLTDEELELDLSLDLADEDGDAPAEGMVTTSADEVALDPGGTATVDVTVDVDEGDLGLYGGYLLAEHAEGDGETVASTPMGFFKEPERYDLVVNGLDRNGDPATGNSSVAVMNVDDRDEFFESSVSYVDGVATTRVPPGRYAVFGLTYTYDEQGEEYHDIAAVAAPEIEVSDDTELTLDARDAETVEVETPAHDVEPRLLNAINLYREPASGPGFARGAIVSAEGRTFSALPSAEAETGAFEFNTRWQLADPENPIDTPVLYDVVLPETGRIPGDLDYVLRPDELVTSHQEFHAHVPDHPAREYRYAWRPWQSSAIGIAEDIPTGAARTDYLSPADTTYSRTVLFAPPSYSSFAARMSAPMMRYEPGTEQTRSWFKQATKPGLIEGSPWHRTFTSMREGDTLDLTIVEWSDSTQGHWGHYNGSIDDTEFRLYEDGELVSEETRAWGTHDVSPDPATIRMELDVSRRGEDWWRYSTATSTAWEFESERPADEEAEALPLLLVDYDLPVDLLNRAQRPGRDDGSRTIGLRVRHQPGFEETPEIAGARLWTSTDDGQSWRRVRTLEPTGDGEFRARLDQGFSGAEAVSVRVEAWDADGNRIEQEIERAFGPFGR